MERTTAQEGVELDLLKTARSAQAFFVTRGHKAGRRLSFSLGFCAFEDDDVAGHGKKRERSLD